jgi:LmbE family N-acetylglucosaminyl deacetylase
VNRLFRAAGTAVLIAVAASQVATQFPPAPGTGPGLPETIEAIDAARVTTRILYITAHPDDESAAVLSYLARGLHADVALLSITRGEGGQNALGPEQAPQLGLIRTQELLAATRGYGVKLYFTRAKDFGYSKTPEETEKIWGDQVLEDMVRVIRAFRPNIVINHFGGVHSGHGHHQTAGLWTPKAVQLAADPSYKLAAPSPDEAPWNPSKPVTILDLDRSDSPKGYVLPLDGISPLYGKSYREIGLDAFVNHRTQGIAGFLNSPFIRRQIALVPEQGGSFEPAQLAEPLSSLWTGCKAFSDAQDFLGQARAAVLKGDTRSAIQDLVSAGNDVGRWMDKCAYHLAGTPAQQQFLADIQRSHRRINRALALVSGIQLMADADTSDLVLGNTFHVTTHAVSRKESECAFGAPTLILPPGMELTSKEGDAAKGFQFTVAFDGKADTGHPDTFPFSSSRKAIAPLLPETPPLVVAKQEVTVAGYTMTVEEPVTHVEATSTSVVRVPLRIVPAYTITVEPKQIVEVLGRPPEPFALFLRVHSYSSESEKIAVGLEVPDGLKADPPQDVTFDGIGDQYVKLAVALPEKLEAGNFTITAYARHGEEKFATSLEPLPSMPTLLWSEPAQTTVYAFDITVPANLRVGYVSAEGEPIPDALRRLGISVEMLDTPALAFGDLSRYSAIVVGVRAYELRHDLAGANRRLLDYVSSGGTLVVQYNRDYIWDKVQPAPYPAKIGSPTPRITDENAEVRFLKPDDRLLNWPNKITAADFQNWVQERGLYFWSDFDAKYTPLMAMNDPGEKDLNGALVYTKYGKGTYIYTGLAFFRELPEGVSGAYRLFVNLLSASLAK